MNQSPTDPNMQTLVIDRVEIAVITLAQHVESLPRQRATFQVFIAGKSYVVNVERRGLIAGEGGEV